MDGDRPSSIEVAPLQADGSLYGFMLIGRWPNDTVEWARFLVLAVQMAAVPGLLPTSTVFRVREELPEQPVVGRGVEGGEAVVAHTHYIPQRPSRLHPDQAMPPSSAPMPRITR